ncbi:MAG TPA: lipoate protein ligase C-terminal domain-containing protein, partial [Atribacterota bacterium]|nr:lipoate protein ligase C-terminal domain-containing protein [Atribacterota bacterium]
DTDLEVMVKVLQVGIDKIESKGIKSIRSRVTNIKPYFNQQITIEVFRESILKELFQGKEVNYYYLDEKDLKEINNLVNTKYSTWEWNFGYSPSYSIKNSRRFPAGKIELFIDVEKGMIKSCQIFGDFLSLCDISEIEKALQNKCFEPEVIEKTLVQFNLKHYFGEITLPEIMTVFFG